MWGGAKPIDLTDFVGNGGVTSAVDVAVGGSVSVTITKTPRFVWYITIPSSSANSVFAYLYDVANNVTLRITKLQSGTSFTVATSSGAPSDLSITSNTVKITNNATGTRSIGVSVIY